MKFLVTYQAEPEPPACDAREDGSHRRAHDAQPEDRQAGDDRRSGAPAEGNSGEVCGRQVQYTDGPFAEIKELIDGFALVNVASKEEALAMCQEFMSVAGDGDGEILQVFDMGEGQPPRR